MENKNSRWDLFISHASEDKETFVRPLAVAHAYKEVTGTTSIAAMRFERVMVDLLNQLKAQLKQKADEIVERARAMKAAIDKSTEGGF